jgi:hypothetical protein
MDLIGFIITGSDWKRVQHIPRPYPRHLHYKMQFPAPNPCMSLR